MGDLTVDFWNSALASVFGTAYAGIHRTDTAGTRTEVSGSTRQLVNESVASGRLTNAAQLSIPVGGSLPTNSEIGWVSLNSAATAGTRYCMFPLGVTSMFEATIDPSTDVISSGVDAHGLNDTDRVCFDSADGVVPSGLLVGVMYFVRDKTPTTFKVSLTSGGTAVGISPSISTGVIVRKCAPTLYSAGQFVELAAGAILLGL